MHNRAEYVPHIVLLDNGAEYVHAISTIQGAECIQGMLSAFKELSVYIIYTVLVTSYVSHQTRVFVIIM